MYDCDGGSGVCGAISLSQLPAVYIKSVLEQDINLHTAPSEESLMYGLFMDGYFPSEQESPSKVVTVTCVWL